MVRHVIAVLGVLVLALDPCFSQDTSCSGDLSWLNDGYCDPENNNLDCGYDGGDCCVCTCVDSPIYDCGSNDFDCRDPACPDEDQPLFPNCTGDIRSLGDGFCDPDTNNLGCDYDGGDCCECTCVDGPTHSCGSNGFNCEDSACLDPAIAIQYRECAGNRLSIGDGLCTAENNNPSCGYDGGDCCLCTCSGRACVYNGFECLDPSADDEIYDCKPPPPTAVPCAEDGQRVWVVEDSAKARALAEAVNCSGGSFQVLWRGEVVVDKTIYVLDGTVLHVTGDGAIASMDGDSTNRLLTVVDASVHVTGVNMSYGAATVGGATAAVRSNVTFDGCTFFRNAASGHGGAIYASDNSVVSFIGHNRFSENAAAMDGGAVFTFGSMCTGENTTFFNNTAGDDGGAVMVTGHSSLSWSGEAVYHGNRAVGSAGALAVQSSSSASWYGETTFDHNSAMRFAGALHVVDASHVSWNATTTFSNNTADFTGGAVRISNGSSASWNGGTRYVGNGGLSGGAMMISGGSVAVSSGNTTFSANTAVIGGGAVYVVDYSNVVWSGETMFSRNVAELGGALRVSEHSIVTLIGETMLSRNLAEQGGAVHAQYGSDLSFDGMATFHGNLAMDLDGSDKSEQFGGALAVIGATVTLSGNTTFSSNTAETQGGAVYVSDGSIVTWDGETTFSSNLAGRGGAVFAQNHAELSFGGMATFHGNLAVGENRSDIQPSGGALAVLCSTLTVGGETLFVDNQALDVGGAVVMASAVAVWTGRASFLNNLGGKAGGALSLFASNAVFGGSTIFHGNIAFMGGAVNAGGSSSVSWNGGLEFVNNSADSGGALTVIDSNVSWSGKTTLAHNRASGNNGAAGGALWLINGSRVSWNGESMFNNNSALGFGGAAYVSWDSNMTWSGDTTFLSCAASFGGALYVLNGSAAEWSGWTEFSSNNAIFSGGAIGSMFLHEQNLRTSFLAIDGPTSFANNTAGATGGGLELNGMLSVAFQSPGVLFTGNSAEIVGGAVFVSSFDVGPVFSAVKFVANFARAGGGAYVTASGNENLNDFRITPIHATRFEGCQFVNNRATATGGAIESLAGQDHISNTIFIGNTAGFGGALRLGGKTFLDNCSFVDNRSGEGAGPAVDNIGFVGRIRDSSFVGNVFNCQPGTYLDSNESGNAFEVACEGCRTSCEGCTFEEVPICVQTMQHTTSSGVATTLETVSIKRGFWRATSTSKEVLACYRDDVCLGGVTGTPGYCRNGYEGPYCSICSDGHATSFGFACEKCSGIAGGIVLTVVLIVFVLIGAAGVASYTMSSKLEGDGRGPIERLTRFVPLHSIKIVIAALQIVTQFTAIANVTYPHVYQRFLDAVNVLNFDLGWISQMSVGCVFDIGIHGRLLIATIGPIIAAMFLGLTYAVAAKASRGSAESLRLIRHRHISVMLLLTFLVYSSVSSILFQMFACDDLEDGKNYLRADYRVECDSSQHIAFQVYAGFMILLYTVGIPALYASLLFRNRGVLKDEVGREDNPRTQAFSDLWTPYKPSTFYYEVIECGRRVLLTGAVVFIYPDTSAQIAVTLMIAFVFVVISEGLAPFASRWNTWISRMGHVVVFASMYVALLLKVDVSNERSGSQKVFEGVLVAAHLAMLLTVIVEVGVMACSLRETVRERILPRSRGTI